MIWHNVSSLVTCERIGEQARDAKKRTKPVVAETRPVDMRVPVVRMYYESRVVQFRPVVTRVRVVQLSGEPRVVQLRAVVQRVRVVQLSSEPRVVYCSPFGQLARA